MGQPWPHITLMGGNAWQDAPTAGGVEGAHKQVGRAGPGAALWLLERGLQSQHEGRRELHKNKS